MLFLRILGGALAVLLPAVLLLDPHANFYYDWHNHQWLTGYFGEYFRQHGRMPEAISVAGAVGMPQPVFYGFLLYPCLGVLSALLGASLAIRCAVVGALAAQFLAVWLAGRRTLRHEGLAWMTAAAVTWSSHELTNLYNRAALTEFFAAVFLTTAVALGIAAVAEDGAARRRCLAVLAIFFATLMVGSHPPTALVAAGFLGALLMVAALSRWRERSAAEVRVIAVCAMLGAVVVAPWVYANLRLQDQLGITARYRELSLSAERWDSPWLRFSPVPFDPQPPAVKHDPAAGTPFVEAPLRFALLMLGAWNAWLLWRVAWAPAGAGVGPASEGISPMAARWLAALGLVWFALTVSISISRTMVDAFRFLAPYVQFATRFVSHANAGLLVFVLASGAMVARCGGYGRFRKQTALVVGAGGAIALLAVAIKLGHAAQVKVRGGEPQFSLSGERTALVAPGKTDAAGDYATLRRWPQLLPRTEAAATHARFPVGERGAKFGIAEDVTVELAQPGWVVINAVFFPWGRVLVDGREVGGEDLATSEFRWAARLPAGTHRLSWVWRPDERWSALHMASQAAWLALLAITLGVGVAELRRTFA